MRRSLHLRLLAFAGGAIAAALFVAWLGLSLLFERHSERQLHAELERHGLALIAGLSLDEAGRPLLGERPFDPRFERPASGLYWRISAPGGELRSRSLWDGDLPTPSAPPPVGWARINAAGPFEPRVLAVVRDVQLDPGGPQALIEVAADRAPVARARAAFAQETAAFLVLLWLALTLAALVQVRLGLAPLVRVRHALEAMRRDPAARLANGAHPREIQPLAEAIDAFADRRAEDVARARRRARDLAHALKTPLTALRLQIDALPPKTARDLAHSLALVSGAVEGELARTGETAPGSGVAAAAVIDRLMAVVGRTPDGKRLSLRNSAPVDLTLPLEPEAALEALGALIENAARHASSLVEVTGGAEPDLVWLEVGDDGPGAPPHLRAAMLDRGVRLDQRGSRHGLGLSIAADFVQATGGVLTLGEAAAGGLSVRLEWRGQAVPPQSRS